MKEEFVMFILSHLLKLQKMDKGWGVVNNERKQENVNGLKARMN